jgi:tetratricopeptide (TPR) repeat protein
MEDRFSFSDLYKVLVGHRTSIIVAVVACFAIYPAIAAHFHANLNHLALMQLFSSNNAWIETIISKKLLVDDITFFDKMSATVEHDRSITAFSEQCMVKDDPIECAFLSSTLHAMALWHFSHGRQELGELFTTFDSIHHHQDTISLPILSSLGARGIILEVGALLNEQRQFARATLYLEAALVVEPTSYPIIRQLAILYFAEQDYCSLMQISGVGVEYYDSALFYYYLGRAYEGLEAWDMAVSAYEQALARFPNYEPYEQRLNRVNRFAANNESSNMMIICD